MSTRARAAAVRAAARAEQEIRAYPRVYALFYRALTSSPAARRAVGRVKDRVRAGASGATAPAAPSWPVDPGERRRAEAVATRLGLST